MRSGTWLCAAALISGLAVGCEEDGSGDGDGPTSDGGGAAQDAAQEGAAGGGEEPSDAGASPDAAASEGDASTDGGLSQDAAAAGSGGGAGGTTGGTAGAGGGTVSPARCPVRNFEDRSARRVRECQREDLATFASTRGRPVRLRRSEETPSSASSMSRAIPHTSRGRRSASPERSPPSTAYATKAPKRAAPTTATCTRSARPSAAATIPISGSHYPSAASTSPSEPFPKLAQQHRVG